MQASREIEERPSIGWALVALGALSIVRAFVVSEPPARPESLGTRVELALDRLSGEEFRLLPGVGPVLAERLEAARVAAGGRLRERDLDGIPGIGPALRERWRTAGLLSSP